jgi:hypothetical protein
MDWGLLAIWLVGIPGAYSVTRPSDGPAMRWFEALFWPIVLNGAVLLLTVGAIHDYLTGEVKGP